MYYETDGQGEPVLLLPGWGGSITDLNRLRQALGEGFRVIAADLPGCGRSEPRVYTPDFYTQDARAFLGLLDDLGVHAAHLVGFSDGGETALLMAALAPERALSVVAWGAAGQIVEPPGGFGPLERLLDEPSERLLPLAAYLAEAYGPVRAREMAAGWGGALRDIVAAGGDVSLSRAGAIKCAVLLVVGSDDPYCPAAVVQELAAAIPRARFLELENVGHDVHLVAPDVLTTVVLDWLGDH